MPNRSLNFHRSADRSARASPSPSLGALRTHREGEGPAELLQRRKPASGVYDPNDRALIVFITVCTKGRRPLLANAAMHELLRDAWTEASHWLVGRYVIMPDHVHLFASPAATCNVTLNGWMQYWKSLLTQTLRSSGRKDVPPHIWESLHWDRRLRSAEHYDEKWNYVAANPVRHGLVPNATDWPYQGGLSVLRF